MHEQEYGIEYMCVYVFVLCLFICVGVDVDVGAGVGVCATVDAGVYECDS